MKLGSTETRYQPGRICLNNEIKNSKGGTVTVTTSKGSQGEVDSK